MSKTLANLNRRLAQSLGFIVGAALFVILLSFSHLYRETWLTHPYEWRTITTVLVATLTCWTLISPMGRYASFRRARPIRRSAIAAVVSAAIFTPLGTTQELPQRSGNQS